MGGGGGGVCRFLWILIGVHPKRNSDSLNKGLPIKMVREKFQRKLYFSMKKIVILTLELYAQVIFALDKYLIKIWAENTVFAFQHIGNRKRYTEVLPPPPPPPPVTKLILLHTVVVLHLTHHIK